MTDRQSDRKTEHQQITPLLGARKRAMQQAQLSRRRFLASTGALGTVAAGGYAAVQAQDATSMATPQTVDVPAGLGAEWELFEGVPETPHHPPGTDFQALTADEAMAVEALTARLLPGTPDDPGAREAGVVYYIDFLLSQSEGFVESTYRSGPWARGYEGEEEPEPVDDVIWVPAEELSRYGYQAPLSPLRIYQIGLKALADYADAEHGTPVGELEDDQLDEMIWAMLRNEIEQFEEFSPISFFHTLRLHTAEGFFSDPAYGGNRDMAGWRLVGFPGSQRSYSPQEMQTEGTDREPQPMHGLPEFNPGHSDDDPVMPVRGSDPELPDPANEDDEDDDSP